MTCVHHGLSASRWSYDDGELSPHKGPVAENLRSLGSRLRCQMGGRPERIEPVPPQ